MDLVTQDSYEETQKQSTAPRALVKEKRNKTGTYTKNTTIFRTNKNNYAGKSTQKKTIVDSVDKKSGQHYSNTQQRPWSVTTQTGTLRKSMPQHQWEHKKRINYIAQTYDDEEEENETKEIRQAPQINRILPDKNDYHEIKQKYYRKYQIITIDTGSPVTIMPNNSELYNQNDM